MRNQNTGRAATGCARFRTCITRNEGLDTMQSIGNFLLFLGAWVLAYTGFPGEPAAILAVLMVMDFASGLAKAHAIGEVISSRRMKSGAASKALILLMPLAVALAAKGMGQDYSWMLTWVISVLILAELYSFIANIYAIRTGESLPEFDVISIIGKKIQRMLEHLMDIK